MAYIQFIVDTQFRKVTRGLVLTMMDLWSKDKEIEVDKDIAGYEINYHFKSEADLTFFLLNPPPLPIKFEVVN